MKDWPKEWKVLVIPNKVPIAMKQVKDGPSKQSTSPIENKRKEIEHAKGTRGSTTTIKTRQKHTIPKPLVQEKEHTIEPNGGVQKDTNIPMSKET